MFFYQSVARFKLMNVSQSKQILPMHQFHTGLK